MLVQFQLNLNWTPRTGLGPSSVGKPVSRVMGLRGPDGKMSKFTRLCFYARDCGSS